MMSTWAGCDQHLWGKCDEGPQVRGYGLLLGGGNLDTTLARAHSISTLARPQLFIRSASRKTPEASLMNTFGGLLANAHKGERIGHPA
jgi:hypothetical protein